MEIKFFSYVIKFRLLLQLWKSQWRPLVTTCLKAIRSWRIIASHKKRIVIAVLAIGSERSRLEGL